MEKYDFSGWATRNDLKCSDGRTIRKNAFAHNDGKTVPLVWNHQHNDPNNVLGHALLENRDEGVYAYCTFNSTESGKATKELVSHGDVVSLSIYANQLKQNGADVLHGMIREVSLVLAGANPGAYIDSIICHGEESEDEAVIYTGENVEVHNEEIKHADESETESESDDKVDTETEAEVEPETDAESNETQSESTENEESVESNDDNQENNDSESEEIKHSDDPAKGKTIQEMFDEFTEEQKNVVYAIIGELIADENNEKEGEENMKHNVFENETQDNTLIHNDEGKALTHADVAAIFEDAKKSNSLKETTLAHGVSNIDYLFPDDRYVGDVPGVIKRDNTWVSKFLGKVHHSPFSRVKSLFANLTEDEARAKGYIKGNLKKEQVFSLLKRSTTPVTIYKKQKLDRDDIIDITDFNVVGFIKTEMREMLDEEIARAALIGDGRLSSSDDKINEQNIRPIWKDEELYTIVKDVEVGKDATSDAKAKAFIRACVKARKDYKGSGNPTLFTTEDQLTDCLLLEDNNGRVIYDTVAKLATALRVSEIVTVEVMENQTREVKGVNKTLKAIIVNPTDYNIGADKGGAVNMFDDFDIDYNQQKYLIETRCSGALVKPYSAIVIEEVVKA